MGWLDRAKERKAKDRDRLLADAQGHAEKEKARQRAAEEAIAPALAPYLKVAEEFCSQTGWRVLFAWSGPADHKSLSLTSPSWSKSYMGITSNVQNTAGIVVSTSPLKTTVGGRKPNESRSSFVREFPGISEDSLKQALEALYLWE